MDQLTGSVTRLVFRNPETTYTVLRLAPDKPVRLKVSLATEPTSPNGHDRHADDDSSGDAVSTTPRQASFFEPDELPKLVTVVGDFASVEVGQQLWVLGEWMDHPQHGRQFKAERWKVQLPTSLAGMQAYLASGMVRGIGPALASAIVEAFRDDTFEVIEREPHRLREVPGIGEARIRIISQVWHEHRAARELMAFLQAQDLPPLLALKIFKTLGPEALALIQADPYRLTEIHGIHFRTADRLATQSGWALDAPERLAAGLRWALATFAEQGHTYAPYAALLAATGQLLAVPAEPLAARIDELAVAGDQLVLDESLGLPERPVYAQSLHQIEVDTAAALRQLAAGPVAALAGLQAELSDEQIAWATTVAGQAHLSAEQRQAVRAAVTHKLSIITGGPGTGKTICLRTLVALLELYRYRCVLVSPTGRAARRLAAATGHEAHTIHRLLGYTGSGFAGEPVEADVVIVDEASMMDLPLTRQLLAALRPEAHLVLVGDVDQLPAVGPGTVLRDLMASGLAAVTRLTHIFRQAQSSLIVTNAHRIIHGQPLLLPQRDCDFFFFVTPLAADAANLVVDIVARRIPEQFGAALDLADPLRDIQVMAPMYKGRAGVDQLNARLQAALNPPAPGKPERVLARCTFRVGDKVMITRNDYERDVSNGDVGYLSEIDPEAQRVCVDVDGRPVAYDFVDLDELTLAYAISIHKSQGSEYPAVVLPLLGEHSVMLYRQLLYTGVTRARRLCVLVGARPAIERAIATDRGPNRYSALSARLQRG